MGRGLNSGPSGLWDHPSSKAALGGVIVGFLLHMAYELVMRYAPSVHSESVPIASAVPPHAAFRSGDPGSVPPRSYPVRVETAKTPPINNPAGALPKMMQPAAKTKAANMDEAIALLKSGPVDENWAQNYSSILTSLQSQQMLGKPHELDIFRAQLKELLALAHSRGEALLQKYPEIGMQESSLEIKLK